MTRIDRLSESWGDLSYGEESEDLGHSSASERSFSFKERRERYDRATALPTRSSHSRRVVSHSSSIAPEFVMPSPSTSEDYNDGSYLHSSNPELSTSRNVDESPRPTSARKRRSRPMQRVSPPTSSSAPQSPAQSFLANVFYPVFVFLMSTLGGALNILKPLFSFGLAVLLFSAVLTLATNYFKTTISTTLTPLCYIPGASRFNLPFCEPRPARPTAGPVEFDELMTVQSAFEDVLASSSEGAGLPADMRRTETVVRDLRQVVRFSTLPSKNELEFEFSGFIDTARKASGDLTRFNSRIGRAVDHILSTNRWTLQVIEGVTEREENRGALARIMESAPWPLAARQTPREALVDQYLRHTRAVEEEIAQLISEAQALLGILENLDERLDAIHGIAMRDGLSTQGRREELFAQLWTRLGGNRAQAAKLEAQLRLLKDVHTYRQTAWAHVSATVLKLEAIAAGLEDLRERVAAPETAGEVAPDLPITLHIDNIMRGVERLEQQRDSQRRIQLEGYRRVLERGGSGDERMIEGKNGH